MLLISTVNYHSSTYTCKLLHSIFTSFISHNIEFCVCVLDNSCNDNEFNEIEDFLCTKQSYSETLQVTPILSEVLEKVSLHTIIINNSPVQFFNIKSLTNCGFGSGCNLTVQTLGDLIDIDWIWFLNNDCVVKDKSINDMCFELNALPKGIYGTIVLNKTFDGSHKIQACGGGVINPFLATTQLMTDIRKCKNLDFIYGASLVIHRTIFSHMNGFDISYFHFYEETDLCWRAKKYYPLEVITSCAVLHDAGSSSGNSNNAATISLFCDFYACRNRVLFGLKHLHPSLPIIILGLFASSINRLFRLSPKKFINCYFALFSALVEYFLNLHFDFYLK